MMRYPYLLALVVLFANTYFAISAEPLSPDDRKFVQSIRAFLNKTEPKIRILFQNDKNDLLMASPGLLESCEPFFAEIYALRRKNPRLFIQTYKQYILDNTKKNKDEFLLWEPFIFATLRDYPEIGREHFLEIIEGGQIHSKHFFELFRQISPYIDVFIPDRGIDSGAMASVLLLVLQEESMARDAVRRVGSNRIVLRKNSDGVYERVTLDKRRTQRVPMRRCDVAQMFACRWFLFDKSEIEMISPNNAEHDDFAVRDKLISKTGERLIKIAAAAKVAEECLKLLIDQTNLQLSPVEFDRISEIWQGFAQKHGADAAFMLNLDILFAQIIENAKRQPTQRDIKMTVHLAQKVSDVLAVDDVHLPPFTDKMHRDPAAAFEWFYRNLKKRLNHRPSPPGMTIRYQTLERVADMFQAKWSGMLQ